MSEDAPRVGWIGTGKMGRPMSRRVLNAGMPVTIYEPLAQNRASLVAEGAEVAHTLADLLAAADIVALTIPNDQVLDELALGAGGFAGQMRPGQILMEMSTVSPDISARLAATLAERGVAYLRAPVSGSTATAASGQLSVIVSGPEAAFHAARPVLACFSAHQFHVGNAEEARYLKLVLNALVGSMSALVAEALTLGRKGGLDTATMLDVIAHSAVASPLLAYKRDLLVSRDFDPAFTVEQMMKDFDLILGAARHDHVPMQLTALVRQQYEGAYAAGLAGQDFFVLLEQSERQAGFAPTEASTGAGYDRQQAAAHRR